MGASGAFESILGLHKKTREVFVYLRWRNQTRCYRDECLRKKLVADEVVCQVSLGEYWPSYQTPTRGGVIGEWHAECFEESFSTIFTRKAKAGQCYFCQKNIRDREEVIYGVKGIKPQPPYVRPEQRGHSILFLVCKKCMQVHDLGRISYWYRVNFNEEIALSELLEDNETG